ncbi:hypothetical protein K8S17_05610 [bacterium]|nr:hypothetical protein [bacterium]
MGARRRVATRTVLPAPFVVAATVALAALTAGAAPTVFVHPSELMVEPGETFSMSIRVDAGTDTVTCFLTEFTFDADVLELVSASEGSLFSMCGYGTMYHWDPIESGLHSCNDVTLGHEAHVLPPGELVDFEFHADGAGVTWIEITTVDLRDMRRDPILPVSTERALVCVTATDVEDPPQPQETALLSVHPNPCRGPASLQWSAPTGLRGSGLLIYDIRGRLIWRTKLDGASGTAQWGGCGRDGSPVRTGTYFVEFRTDVGGVVRRKLILLR